MIGQQRPLVRALRLQGAVGSERTVLRASTLASLVEVVEAAGDVVADPLMNVDLASRDRLDRALAHFDFGRDQS